MVLPISGPFGSLELLKGPPAGNITPYWYVQTRRWFRQVKPYDLPLETDLNKVQVTTFRGGNGVGYVDIGMAGPLKEDYFDIVQNKALEKLKSDIGDESMWSVNLKEWKQSFDLISGPATTLWQFSRKLRRFDFPGAAKVLKSQVPRGLKPTAKHFGDNWLKYHFGIEPLMKDIAAGVNTLQSPLPSKEVSGRSVFKTPNERLDAGILIYNTVYETRCRLSCRVEVSNPNLFLANQLGFTNPATFIWETIPFSFVVDWFANVGQFLGQFSMFAGLEILNPQTSLFQVANRTVIGGSLSPDWADITATIDRVYMTRRRSLPGVTLKVTPWKAPSPTRAATAISLLVQQLKK